MPAARTASSRGSRSSPSTTAMRSRTPAASAALRNAFAQACGWIPPALLSTFVPRAAIFASTGASAGTKSVA